MQMPISYVVGAVVVCLLLVVQTVRNARLRRYIREQEIVERRLRNLIGEMQHE